ncbi:MAG: hypothetical protein JOZ42_07470 [Acetobacteraceae bacterium]|nr:hypothetical protein [Acetobacteraceae bacterium]
MHREIVRVALIAGGLLGIAGPVSAQHPSQSQIAAIRSSCRSDYQSYCASVPTGGQQALSCLQEHAANLSPQCGQAVAAVGGGSGAQEQSGRTAPQSGGNPRQATSVLREECGMDYRTHCRGVRPGGGRAIACLKEHQDSLSSGCQNALSSLRSAR